MKWESARKAVCALCGERHDGMRRGATGKVICFECALDVVRVTNEALKARAKREARIN